MKVNRKYLNGTPELSEYVNLIKQISLVQKQINELVPRNVELTFEISNDVVDVCDEHGYPHCFFNLGFEPTDQIVLDSAALALRDCIQGMK